MANGDIRNIDDIVKQPLEKCLLFLAYKADKNFLEKILHENAVNGIK